MENEAKNEEVGGGNANDRVEENDRSQSEKSESIEEKTSIESKGEENKVENNESKHDEVEEVEKKEELKAPETYEFKNEDIATEVKDAFIEVSRELDLSQEDADKVLDKMLPVLEKRTADNLEAISNEWQELSRKDKEIGGNKLDENIGFAKRAMEEFATPELNRLLNDTSLGNHPEVIRLMSRIGRAVSQDSFVGSTSSTPINSANQHLPNDRETIANTLYPSKK